MESRLSSVVLGVLTMVSVVIIPVFTFSDVLFGESFLQNKVVLSGYFDHGAHQYVHESHPWSTWEARWLNGFMGFVVGATVFTIGGFIVATIDNCIYDHNRKAEREKEVGK